MLLNMRKKKEHKIIRFSNVENIIMETEGMHFEFSPIDRVVKYRNVISPKYGNMVFPDGYFDEKKVTISQDDMKLISATFDRMFQRRTPENRTPEIITISIVLSEVPIICIASRLTAGKY